jgi:ASPIC/UnbV protein/VCBS repeat protein/type IX secretion system substrate protein
MRRFCLLIALAVLPAQAQTFTDASVVLLDPAEPTRIVFGASVADANRDGKPDLYQSARLFLQQERGLFRDILEGPRFGTPDGSEVFGAVFGDGDGDGFPDLYVEDLDPGSRYFKNRFGLRWDLAPPPEGPDMTSAQSQGASWADYDRDGDLDLFVGEEFGSNRYFENIGGGVFRDTGQPGILNDRHSYGVAANDYDRDGDIDVFIAACFSGPAEKSVNALFRNEGDGTFVEVAVAAGVADSLAGWGVVWLDYDRDSWPDVFVANMPIFGPDARPGFNKLYRNLGDGTFEDVSDASGMSGGTDDWGFGASAADFDNDGWEDVYLANDFSPHRLLRNQGDGTFVDIMPELGLLPIEQTIAAAVGDINSDGWIDVFTASRMGSRLFMNNGGQNHYLSVTLRGGGMNVDAIGARVTAWVGGARMQREISAGDGMTSQNHNMTAHFGLGTASTVDTLIVEWPSGGTTRFRDVAADQHFPIVKGAGLNHPPDLPVLAGPVAGSHLGQLESFSWTPATDPDGDPVTYTLAVLSLNDRTPTGEMIVSGLEGTIYQADLSGITDGDYIWTVIAEDGHWRRAATTSATFRKGGVTSFESSPEIPSVELFPNPVSGWATLTLPPSQTGAVRVDIVDLLGRTVASYDLVGPEAKLDLTKLAPGMYLVRPNGAQASVPIVVSR